MTLRGKEVLSPKLTRSNCRASSTAGRYVEYVPSFLGSGSSSQNQSRKLLIARSARTTRTRCRKSRVSARDIASRRTSRHTCSRGPNRPKDTTNSSGSRCSIVVGRRRNVSCTTCREPSHSSISTPTSFLLTRRSDRSASQRAPMTVAAAPTSAPINAKTSALLNPMLRRIAKPAPTPPAATATVSA